LARTDLTVRKRQEKFLSKYNENLSFWPIWLKNVLLEGLKLARSKSEQQLTA
jgi:hypothetical protein